MVLWWFAGPGVEFVVVVIMVVCRSWGGVCYCYNGGLQALGWSLLLL